MIPVLIIDSCSWLVKVPRRRMRSLTWKDYTTLRLANEHVFIMSLHAYVLVLPPNAHVSGNIAPEFWD